MGTIFFVPRLWTTHFSREGGKKNGLSEEGKGLSVPNLVGASKNEEGRIFLNPKIVVVRAIYNRTERDGVGG